MQVSQADVDVDVGGRCIVSSYASDKVRCFHVLDELCGYPRERLERSNDARDVARRYLVVSSITAKRDAGHGKRKHSDGPRRCSVEGCQRCDGHEKKRTFNFKDWSPNGFDRVLHQ